MSTPPRIDARAYEAAKMALDEAAAILNKAGMRFVITAVHHQFYSGSRVADGQPMAETLGLVRLLQMQLEYTSMQAYVQALEAGDQMDALLSAETDKQRKM